MFQIIPQLLINGLIAGSLYALLALGLSLTYGIFGYINFAHAEMAVIGGYVFYYGYAVWHWGFFASAAAAVAITVAAGYLIQKTLYEPLQNRSSHIIMLGSIGASILIQNIILLAAGGDVKSFDHNGNVISFMNGDLTITTMQILAIGTSFTLMGGLFLFLRKTKLGRAIRAVADNRQAASIVGINPAKITTLIFAIGNLLAAIAGMFIAYEYSIYPALGTPLIVKAFVPVIFGGVGSTVGAIIGAFAVGIVENLGIGITVGSHSVPAGFKDAFAFLILIIILFVKPGGLFGEKTEEASRKI